ncbi:MAG: DUF58 domain-containing protein [Candidatus Brocadiia bacterium]
MSLGRRSAESANQGKEFVMENEEPAAEKPQLTPLLSNEALSRLERMRIQSRRRFTNRSRGEHLAGRSGASTEFCDYRDYVPGDDVRFVDWNIFARLNRPYLKLYHQEEEVHVVLLVDGSTSMLFERKLDWAKELAAAFGVMALNGTERLSLYSFRRRDAPPHRLAPCRGRASMKGLFAAVEAVEGGGDVPLEVAMESLLKHHTGRGVVVVLSDFLTFGDLGRAMNRLFTAGLEIFGLQLLGPTEIDPEVGGDTRFVDSETAATLDVSAADDLLPLYQEHRIAYERNVAALCQQRSGRFLTISTADTIEWVLFDLLRRKGWAR